VQQVRKSEVGQTSSDEEGVIGAKLFYVGTVSSTNCLAKCSHYANNFFGGSTHFDLPSSKRSNRSQSAGSAVLDDQATQRYPSIDACNGLDTDAALSGLASDWMPERIVRDLGVSAPANLGRRFASENDAYSLAASESCTKKHQLY
jgi:hypothetical protein